MAVGLPYHQVRSVKNREFSRVGKVMDSLIVTFTAPVQEYPRRHAVVPCIRGIPEVVRPAANPHGITGSHNGIRLLERGEGFRLRTRIAVVTVGGHVVDSPERIGRGKHEPRDKQLPIHNHLTP